MCQKEFSMNRILSGTIMAILLTALLAVFFNGCCPPKSGEDSVAAVAPLPIVEFDPASLTLKEDPKGFDVEWKRETPVEGIHIVTMTLKGQKPVIPEKMTVQFKFPSVGVEGFWNPNLNVDKVNYYRNTVTSRSTRYAPVSCFYDPQDINRMTIACSDALNKVIFRSYLKEEDANFHCSFTLFDERQAAIDNFTVQFRFDLRPRPYYETVNGVSRWWEKQELYRPAAVPDNAKLPMYSTWYSFHQNLVVDDVVNECRLAKLAGFEAVIVDDGWQTMDNKRGYAFTGDWKPERIGDMKAFVDKIHQLDMKFLLWYSVPFIGEKAANYELFKGKYLRYWDGQGAYVLDPRYPEVREFIIDTYETALENWKLDGFKLDFIGFFTTDQHTVMTAADGRDFASVNRAVDRLMTDIMVRLKAIEPNIMIEFRQPYIGPLMRKYGNMFRAADCPNNAVVNRVRTTDIRLLCGATATHSDMYMWHSTEPAHHAASQLLNVLFTVPQLSVRLDSIPTEHTRMIEFWTKYWRENRHVLLDGEFQPHSPQTLYPLIQAKGNDKIIAALYRDVVAAIDNAYGEAVDMVNGKQSSSVVIKLAKEISQAEIRSFDCFGNESSLMRKRLKPGLHQFAVPPSGLLTIRSASK
jgi:alpha-galactosidase